MTLRQTHTVPVAAAKAAISQATGYRLHADPTLPSQKKTPRGRRRPDPLADIFDTEVVPLLQSSPKIRPVSVYEDPRTSASRSGHWHPAQERQLAIQKKKGTLVDRARAETLVFRLARQERDVWVTWPSRVAALMAAEVALGVEKQSGTPYHDQASLCGVGCDCLGLARGVWREVVGPEPFPMPPYSRDWGEMGPHEVLAEGARRMMVECPPADAPPGALVLFRMMPRALAKHVGILRDGRF